MLFLQTDIIAKKAQLRKITQQTGGNRSRVTLFKFVWLEVGVDNHRAACHKPGVNQGIEYRGCECGRKFGAEVIENEQVGVLKLADGTLRFRGIDPAEFDRLIASQNMDCRVIGDRKACRRHHARDAGGKKGFSEPCRTEQQEIGGFAMKMVGILHTDIQIVFHIYTR